MEGYTLGTGGLKCAEVANPTPGDMVASCDGLDLVVRGQALEKVFL